MVRRHRFVSRLLALLFVLAPSSVFLPGLTSSASALPCVGAGVDGTGVWVCPPV